MSSRKKKKSIFRSTFYRVYFALVLLALASIAFGTVWLRGKLADYESAQPVYTATEVAKLFEDRDFARLYALDSSAAQVSEGDAAFYAESLGALTEGKRIEWTEAFSADEDERRYTVTLDGERFASFTLVPSGETTAGGNRLWKLGSVATNVTLRTPEPTPEPTPAPTPVVDYRCRVSAPKGYTVTVDGVNLGDDNAETSERELFEAGFLPEGVANPVMVDYAFVIQNGTPEITATDEAGTAATVVPVPDQPMCWSCSLREDAAMREQYSSGAIALGKQVAKYISQDANKKAIQRICAKGSPAEDIFENLGNLYATPHTGLAFRNETATDFYSLSENCFTCRVSFDFILETKNGDMDYPTSYTFCVVRVDDKYRLYNILSY